MQKVGLKTLKNKLSEFVRLAAAGETIVITDRGRAVAEIVPPQPRTELTAFEEKGVREGWLRPARIRDGTPPPRHPMVPFDELMRELEHDREDRV
jgi:prevent-host-death family protein